MCSIAHGTLSGVARLRAIVCVIVVASCNYDWTFRPDAGTATEKDAGGDRIDPGIDSGSPIACSLGKACPSGQFCWFSDRACGSKNALGECRSPANDCKDAVVCGCDGAQSNGCELWKQKALDYDDTGASCAGPSTFKCEFEECVVSKQVCVTQSGATKCVDCASGCKCPGLETCTCTESVPGQVRIECK